ncbi:MAG: flagellar filament capping protein FliD [Gammaproteobacteria bacterium]|jgi:flagellar hook-associated protein 2|nr:flagellar filament capping protein FliD [Gammaproteobacteria bacterium]
MVSAPGIGSGLDINGLVEQLVAAERGPAANRLNLAEARTNSELSAVGRIKSAVSSFQSALDSLTSLETFQQRTVNLDADESVSVTASSRAVPGSYDVQVIALATAQKLASQAFGDITAPVGTGILNITLGPDAFAVNIAEGENSLVDIRDAINAAGDNPGVLATIVTADDGSRLILSSARTGSANTITVANTGGNGGLDVFNYDPQGALSALTELESAADAMAMIDGFTVSSSTNSVDGAIEGVDIDLLAAEPGNVTRVTIGLDETAATTALNGFVNAYNGLLGTIAEVTAFDAETGVAGALLGDSLVRDLQSSLRRTLSSSVELDDAPFSILAEIGITTTLNGQLELDETRAADAISADFDAVGLLFAAENDGIAVRIDALLSRVLDDSGTILLREERLNGRLEELRDQRTRLDERMERVEARLFAQFQALDGLLSQLSSTSSFLTSQLANLPTPRAIRNNS